MVPTASRSCRLCRGCVKNSPAKQVNGRVFYANLALSVHRFSFQLRYFPNTLKNRDGVYYVLYEETPKSPQPPFEI